MPKTVIFSGGFGSGKSEIALNYALKRFKQQPDLVLADLDLINPYFVIRNQADYLKRVGLTLIAPSGKFAHTDLPSVPSTIIGVLNSRSDLVIDLAGDEAGATVLGYLSTYVLRRESYEFLLVINPYRPFAEHAEDLVQMVDSLERGARIKFTGIISNPNLIYDTTVEDIIAGHEKVVDYSKQFQLPVNGLAVKTAFYPDLYPIYEDLLMPIDIYLGMGNIN